MAYTLTGVGVSPGRAVGPAVIVAPAVGIDPTEAACTDPEADAHRVRDTLKQVSASLLARAENAGDTARAMLQATASLASDRALITAIEAELHRGTGITRALFNAVELYASRLRAAGGVVAERVTDLYDVRDRTLARLQGLPEPEAVALTHPSVVVATDLSPAEAVQLERDLVLGIVLESGGATAHTAILAAQWGIPAVVQTRGVTTHVHPGHQVALDGTTGQVLINPDPGHAATFTQKTQIPPDTKHKAREHATRDGHRISLLANVGSVEDAAHARNSGADGIGLVRTEFLYLGRTTAPSLSEQEDTYAQIMGQFPNSPVIFRTLDVGSDKPLPFADLGPEENPALGTRGIRHSRQHAGLLTTQLRALAKAANSTSADLHVMSPMVTTLEEARWFTERAREHHLPKVGITLETPAAVLQAHQILAELDFASLGTNDLAQYTMAADRLDGNLTDLLSPWQPAVLSLINMVAHAQQETGTPLSVCGEVAGDPLYALVLVGLGIRSLSMTPAKIPAVREALAAHDLQRCQAIATAALAAPTAQAAKQAALHASAR